MGPSALGACISPSPCILMASRCHMMPTSSEDPSETLRLYQLAIDYLIIFASKLPPIVVSPSPEVFASHDASPQHAPYPPRNDGSHFPFLNSLQLEDCRAELCLLPIEYRGLRFRQGR
jgi:hypothetical protein